MICQVEPAIGLEVPALSQHFSPLATVSELSLGSTVDIIGIVTEFLDLYTTTPYGNNKKVWGRRITLVDESNGKVVNIQRVQRIKAITSSFNSINADISPKVKIISAQL